MNDTNDTAQAASPTDSPSVLWYEHAEPEDFRVDIHFTSGEYLSAALTPDGWVALQNRIHRARHSGDEQFLFFELYPATMPRGVREVPGEVLRVRSGPRLAEWYTSQPGAHFLINLANITHIKFWPERTERKQEPLIPPSRGE